MAFANINIWAVALRYVIVHTAVVASCLRVPVAFRFPLYASEYIVTVCFVHYTYDICLHCMFICTYVCKCSIVFQIRISCKAFIVTSIVQ